MKQKVEIEKEIGEGSGMGEEERKRGKGVFTLITSRGSLVARITSCQARSTRSSTYTNKLRKVRETWQDF